MHKIVAVLGALALLFIAEAQAAAQTSKYGIPSFHAPLSGAVQLPATTVAKLPLCDGYSVGILYTVTDAAAAPVYNATATGGGTIRLLVMCNGANWVNH
jgi:hypothetical protein